MELQFSPDLFDFSAEQNQNAGPRHIYSKERYGTVKDFVTKEEHRAEFEEFKNEFEAEVDKLKAFAERHAEAPAGDSNAPLLSSAQKEAIVDNLEEFKSRLFTFNENGRNVAFGGESVDLTYANGKSTFFDFSKLVTNENVPPQTRLNALENLAEKLTVCTGGMVDALYEGVSKLNSAVHGVKGLTANLTEEIARQEIVEFVRRRHKDNSRYTPAMEVHFVNYYFNELTAAVGPQPYLWLDKPFVWPVHPDPDYANAENTGITEEDLKDCYARLKETIRPSVILQQAGERCFQEIKNLAGNVPEENLWTSVDTALKTAASQYGPILTTSLLTFDNSAAWRSSSALVALDMLKDLNGWNLITGDAPRVLASAMPPDEDENPHELMQWDRLFWVREWSTTPTETSDPEKNSDPVPLCMANLSLFSPEDVQTSLARFGEQDAPRVLQNIVREAIAGAELKEIMEIPDAWLGHIPLAEAIQAMQPQDPKRQAKAGEWSVFFRKAITLGADIEQKNAQGQTPLLAAAQQGLPHAFTALADLGATMRVTDDRGWNPLLLWLTEGRDKIVGEERDELFEEVIAKCAGLMEHQNSRSQTPLLTAADWSLRSAFEELLDRGADLRVRGANGENALTLLIKRMPQDTPAKTWDAVFESVAARDKSAFNLRNAHGQTPMVAAANRGMVSVCLKLVRIGADPFVKDNHGNNALTLIINSTPSDWASVGYWTAFFEAMIPKNLGAEEKSKELQTLVQTAAATGHIEAFTVLVDAGADPLAKNSKGENALTVLMENRQEAGVDHWAALFERMTSKASNAEEKNRHIQTFLLAAAEGGAADVFMAAGDVTPDLQFKNAQSKNILQLWLEHGRDDMAKRVIDRVHRDCPAPEEMAQRLLIADTHLCNLALTNNCPIAMREFNKHIVGAMENGRMTPAEFSHTVGFLTGFAVLPNDIKRDYAEVIRAHNALLIEGLNKNWLTEKRFGEIVVARSSNRGQAFSLDFGATAEAETELFIEAITNGWLTKKQVGEIVTGSGASDDKTAIRNNNTSAIEAEKRFLLHAVENGLLNEMASRQIADRRRLAFKEGNTAAVEAYNEVFLLAREKKQLSNVQLALRVKIDLGAPLAPGAGSALAAHRGLLLECYGRKWLSTKDFDVMDPTGALKRSLKDEYAATKKARNQSSKIKYSLPLPRGGFLRAFGGKAKQAKQGQALAEADQQQKIVRPLNGGVERKEKQQADDARIHDVNIQQDTRVQAEIDGSLHDERATQRQAGAPRSAEQRATPDRLNEPLPEESRQAGEQQPAPAENQQPEDKQTISKTAPERKVLRGLDRQLGFRIAKKPLTPMSSPRRKDGSFRRSIQSRPSSKLSEMQRDEIQDQNNRQPPSPDEPIANPRPRLPAQGDIAGEMKALGLLPFFVGEGQEATLTNDCGLNVLYRVDLNLMQSWADPEERKEALEDLQKDLKKAIAALAQEGEAPRGQAGYHMTAGGITGDLLTKLFEIRGIDESPFSVARCLSSDQPLPGESLDLEVRNQLRLRYEEGASFALLVGNQPGNRLNINGYEVPQGHFVTLTSTLRPYSIDQARFNNPDEQLWILSDSLHPGGEVLVTTRQIEGALPPLSKDIYQSYDLISARDASVRQKHFESLIPDLRERIMEHAVALNKTLPRESKTTNLPAENDTELSTANEKSSVSRTDVRTLDLLIQEIRGEQLRSPQSQRDKAERFLQGGTLEAQLARLKNAQPSQAQSQPATPWKIWNKHLDLQKELFLTQRFIGGNLDLIATIIKNPLTDSTRISPDGGKEIQPLEGLPAYEELRRKWLEWRDPMETTLAGPPERDLNALSAKLEQQFKKSLDQREESRQAFLNEVAERNDKAIDAATPNALQGWLGDKHSYASQIEVMRNIVKTQAAWLEEKVAMRLAACSPQESEKTLDGQVPPERISRVLIDLDKSLERDMRTFNQAISLQAELKTLRAAASSNAVDDAALSRTIAQFVALQSGSLIASTQSAPQLAESHKRLAACLLTPLPTPHRGFQGNAGDAEITQALGPLKELDELKPRLSDEIRQVLAEKIADRAKGNPKTKAEQKNVKADPANIVEERVDKLPSFSGDVIHAAKDYFFILVDAKKRQPTVVAATAKELGKEDLRVGKYITYSSTTSKAKTQTKTR